MKTKIESGVCSVVNRLTAETILVVHVGADGKLLIE